MKVRLKHFKTAKNTEAYTYQGDALQVPPINSLYISKAHIAHEWDNVVFTEIDVEVTPVKQGPQKPE